MAKVLKYRNFDELVSRVGTMLEERMVCERPVIDTDGAAVRLLRLKLARLGHEEFAVIFLDAQNRLIAFEKMFRGTINAVNVYLREIAKAALRHNAAGVILSHNHLSGNCKPSRSDEILTERAMEALELINVRVIDHLIICGKDYVSFERLGLLTLTPAPLLQQPPIRRQRATTTKRQGCRR